MYCATPYYMNWTKSDYLWEGDLVADGLYATANGNPDFHAPNYELAATPHVQTINDRIKQLSDHWEWFHAVTVEWSWPCAPKALRYMENLIWSIGQECPSVSLPSFPLENVEPVPEFLRSKQTVVDGDKAAAWWAEFLVTLDTWWRDEEATGAFGEDIYIRLGEPDDIKRWLVRLYAHRLRKLAKYGANVAKLVSGESGWGSKELQEARP